MDEVLNGTEFENNTNQSDCLFPDDNSSSFIVAASLRAFVGLLSSVCCVCLILIILVYKKYIFSTQRLILYLSAAVLLQSLSFMVARVNFYSPRTLIDPYCNFAGLFWLYSGWTELLSVSCITFNLFTVMILQKYKPWFEYVYLVVIFLSPLAWCWIPFIHSSFGTTGPWCGIRYLSSDCQVFQFGNIMRFFMRHIPASVLVFLFILPFNIGISIQARRQITRLQGTRSALSPHANSNMDIKMLMGEVKPLVWYPVIYAILYIPFALCTVYTAIRPANPHLVVWLIMALTTPLAGTAVAVVYALDSETLSRLSWTHLLKRCCSICKKRSSIHEISEYNFDYYSLFGDSFDGNKNYSESKI